MLVNIPQLMPKFECRAILQHYNILMTDCQINVELENISIMFDNRLLKTYITVDHPPKSNTLQTNMLLFYYVINH